MQNASGVWLIKHILKGEMMNKFIRFIVFLVFLNILYSQDVYSISGIVKTPKGKGIKKVKLSIYNNNGKKISDTKSEKGGLFRFKKIIPGEYILKGEHKKEGSGEKSINILNENLATSLIISTEPINQQEGSENIEPDTIKDESLNKLPQQRDNIDPNQLTFDETFFKYDANLKILQSEIDSLKSVVRGYEKKQTMPDVSRELLELIKIPDFQHRIELQNGTVVLGDILEESDSTLTLKTQIGKLVLKKRMVVRMDQYDKPGPKVIFLGDPFIEYYPNYQVFSGRIKNVGEKRADFVRVIGNLWDQTTSSVGIDSVFVKGSRISYDSNVIADTALEPGQSATYLLTITIRKKKKVQYHTMDIRWNETK